MIFRARELLAHVGCGFGALALNGLLAAEAQAVHERGLDPYAGRSPHYEPRAKRVIFLYMPGGPSHVDLLDPKPRLAVDNGKPLPFEKPKLERTRTGNLLASPWKFTRHGGSGIEVSELLPGLASRIDDVCVIRSMVADNINHTARAADVYRGAGILASQSGIMVDLWAGHRESEFARIRRGQSRSRVSGRWLWASSFLPSAFRELWSEI